MNELLLACVVRVANGLSLPHVPQSASSHALFSLSITLSEEGVQKWRQIVKIVFRYIGLLRHFCSLPGGLPDWIYEELRSIDLLSYQYEDESPAEDLVQAIVEDMAPHTFLPPERLLDGAALLFEYDSSAIEVSGGFCLLLTSRNPFLRLYS